MEALLAEADLLFRERKVSEGMTILADLIGAVEGKPAAREQLLVWICERVGDEHPQAGAHIALAGGALVEAGAAAATIGRAIVAPVERALVDAARMIGYAEEYGHAHPHDEDGGADADGDAHDHDHDHGDDEGHSHALEIGGFALSKEELDKIAAKDVAAVRAWFSLEMWYRPAVATWTRDLAVLREVQARPTLRAAVEALGGETATTHWLSLLIEATAGAPFVVLVPELDEAWSFTADGVVDMGQLAVLLSKALADPLQRIGASRPATAAQLAVMSGEGPQSGDDGYSSSFAFYPIEATDPGDGLPRDGIYLWSAPGGTGSHSLPGDFLPGAIAPIDGVRLLVMVGPKAPGLRFVRIIQSSRMFDALAAQITDVRELPAQQAKPLFELARARGKQQRAT